MFYIGGRGCVLCRFIEPVTFARCAFIFALWNIALGGYLDTRRNIKNIYGMTVDLKYIYIYIYSIAKFSAIERTRKLASLAIIMDMLDVLYTWECMIYNYWDDGLGQTGSSILWFVEMNLVQNHNHYSGTSLIRTPFGPDACVLIIEVSLKYIVIKLK